MKETKKYIHSDSLYLEDHKENKIMCSMCREVKDESEFYYRKKQHKYNTYCRDCERIYQREYHRAYREMHPEYVEKNRKKVLENYREKLDKGAK